MSSFYSSKEFAQLVNDAAEAIERFGEQELEEYAELQRLNRKPDEFKKECQRAKAQVRYAMAAVRFSQPHTFCLLPRDYFAPIIAHHHKP